jgi:hypothetical protein
MDEKMSDKKIRSKARGGKEKRINRKGVFYSLSVIILLVFMIIVFNNKAHLMQKEEQSHVERAKIIIMDRFIRDFDRYYAESILQTAAKPALVNLTRDSPFNSSQLIEMMATGIDSVSGLSMNPLLGSNENFQQSLATLSFNLDSASFSYRLESAEQLSYELLRLDFSVDYSFSAFNTNWSRRNKIINITVAVNGLWHPAYDEVIDSSWVENSTGGCYINQIITPTPEPGCTGMNIMPEEVEEPEP